MVKEDRSIMPGCDYGRSKGSSNLELFVHNDKNVLVIFLCGCKRTQNTHCDKIERSRRWKELQLTPVVAFGVVSCAA